nr:immunoglobulin light chain junction region [Macaca mulatta]
CQQHKSYPRTF